MLNVQNTATYYYDRYIGKDMKIKWKYFQKTHNSGCL